MTVFVPRADPTSVDLSLAGSEAKFPFATEANRHLTWLGHRMWTGNLVAEIIRRRFEIFIVWGEVTNVSIWLAILASRLTRRCVVLWTHGIYGREGWLKRKARVWFYRMAAANLLYGNSSRERLVQEGMDHTRLHVIYNSLDYQQQKACRLTTSQGDIARTRKSLESSAARHERILLFVGRLHKRKELDVGVRALQILNRSGPKYLLLMIGDGPEATTIDELSRKLGVKNSVVLLGARFAEAELAPYFMAADLGFCPGALGLFAVHAHAYGLPVITHGDIAWQGPEIEVMTDKITGCFYSRYDEQDLAARVENWFLERPPADVVRRVCIHSVESRYTPERQASAIMMALKTLTSDRP